MEALYVDLVGLYTLARQQTSWLSPWSISIAFSISNSWSYRQSLDWLLRKKTVKREQSKKKIFDKSSDRIARLVDRIWLCRYPRCRYLIYDTGSEFKLHFETLCDSYGIKHKPTTIKNPQANAICECVHQVLGTMMHTAEIDMADSVHRADIDSFIDNAVWAICSTYHTVLKASPGALYLDETCSSTFRS